jgi:signal transduction histidine kinase/FixJ family two-component response regulator
MPSWGRGLAALPNCGTRSRSPRGNRKLNAHVSNPTHVSRPPRENRDASASKGIEPALLGGGEISVHTAECHTEQVISSSPQGPRRSDIVPDLHADPSVVLLVEDNPADAELLSARLEGSAGMPLRLVQVGSVAEARSALRRSKVDVVILDLPLPDAQGLVALYQILPAAPGVPVIVLTGRADQSLALEALRAGAQDYVLKPPPDGPTLRRILRYARERQQLLLELDRASHESAAAARRWRILAEVGAVLASLSGDIEGIARAVSLLVPDAAQVAFVYLKDTGQVPSVFQIAHADANMAPQLGERVKDLLSRPGEEDALFAALGETGSSPAGPARVAERWVTALEMANGVALPLRCEGNICGVLVLASQGERHDGPARLEFGRSIADRISLEIDRFRLLRQARRAVASRDRTFGIVSHDLGDPLSTIQICVRALLDPEPPPTAGVRDMANIIQRSASLMHQIVEDLRDRASLDAGRLALELQATVVADVTTQMQAMFRQTAEDRSLAFVVATAPDLPPIQADSRRLEQVLSNLLRNAMKFTPQGGRVLLDTRLARAGTADALTVGSSDAVRFAVSDTGLGISPENLTHIFDWFWRAPQDRAAGSGLGLAIARGLVEAHGSRLMVESQPGKGTTFWFSLPVQPAESGATRLRYPEL